MEISQNIKIIFIRDAIYFPVKVNQKINFDSPYWISMRRLLFGLTKKLTLWCSLRWLHACHPYLPFYLTFLFNDHKYWKSQLSTRQALTSCSVGECRSVLGTPEFSKTVRSQSSYISCVFKVNKVMFGEVCITYAGRHHLQCKAHRCRRGWTTVIVAPTLLCSSRTRSAGWHHRYYLCTGHQDFSSRISFAWLKNFYHFETFSEEVH